MADAMTRDERRRARREKLAGGMTVGRSSVSSVPERHRNVLCQIDNQLGNASPSRKIAPPVAPKPKPKPALSAPSAQPQRRPQTAVKTLEQPKTLEPNAPAPAGSTVASPPPKSVSDVLGIGSMFGDMSAMLSPESDREDNRNPLATTGAHPINPPATPVPDVVSDMFGDMSALLSPEPDDEEEVAYVAIADAKAQEPRSMNGKRACTSDQNEAPINQPRGITHSPRKVTRTGGSFDLDLLGCVSRDLPTESVDVHRNADSEAGVSAASEDLEQESIDTMALKVMENAEDTALEEEEEGEKEDGAAAEASIEESCVVISQTLDRPLAEELVFQEQMAKKASELTNLMRATNQAAIERASYTQVVETERLTALRTGACRSMNEIVVDAGAVRPKPRDIQIQEIAVSLGGMPEASEFEAFLVFRTGVKAYVTDVGTTVDQRLKLATPLIFEGLEANFEIEVSIYAMEIYNASCEEPSEVQSYHEGLSGIKSKAKNMFKRKLGREKKVAVQKQPVHSSPPRTFSKVGSITIDSSNLQHGRLATPALTGESSELVFSASVTMSKQTVDVMAHHGFITMFERTGARPGAWYRRFARVHAAHGQLALWTGTKESRSIAPTRVLDLHAFGEDVARLSRSKCARRHSFRITYTDNIKQGGSIEHDFRFACDSKADMVTWMDILKKSVVDSKAWQSL